LKVSDAVANFIHGIGTTKVYGVSGGASLHLLNSINEHPDLELICVHHEQSVSMAVDAYSRLNDSIGVGVVTSGPGATNLITGLAGAYYDSIPCLFITGQVSTNRLKGESQVRQIGFQETPITEVVKSISKFAVTVTSPDQVFSALSQAFHEATTGRPGPVVIDIPDDIQRMEIHNISPPGFANDSPPANPDTTVANLDAFITLVLQSERPLIVCGAGIRISKNEGLIMRKIQVSGIPVVPTWGAKDLLPCSDTDSLGTFGTHGNRVSNLVLNEADLVISIGSRLDLKATGSPPSSFAPASKKIMFDIDQHEINKFQNSGLEIDLGICVNLASASFETYLEKLVGASSDYSNWKARIAQIAAATPDEQRIFSEPGVNPYLFIRELSDQAKANSNLLVDTGCAIAWTMQEWRVKSGQRIIHDYNNTAMGWSIPATLASITSNQESKSICLVGDGSLMMALSDLVTINRFRRGALIFVLNNSGYAMIKQTQDQWFGGDYFASNQGRDLDFPDFKTLAEANRFRYFRIESDKQIPATLREILSSDDDIFCEVKIQSDARVVPIVRFGNPNHVMDPQF